ncbi:uncharacterized protein [Eurosta solidaginis]
MSSDPILAELKPCGYILATSQYKFFALNCIYCNNKYADWATFLQHLKRLHYKNSTESQWLPESSKEVVWNPEVGNKETITEGESVYEKSVAATDIDKTDNGLLNDVVYPNEEMVYVHQEEECISENIEYAIETHTNYINPTPVDSYEEYIANTFEELNPICVEIVSSMHELYDLQIDLTKEDMRTKLFIEVYKSFPLLWSIEDISSGIIDQVCIAKTQMLDSLKEKNLFITLDTLENAIFQIQEQYLDLAKIKEKGIEISDIEEKYFLLCSFLQPYKKVKLDKNTILEEAENKSSLTEVNCNDKDSRSGFDLTDDEIEILQNSLQKKQTILKFTTRNKVTCDFIQCLRGHTCLWDPTENAYNDAKESMLAYGAIQKFFLDNHSLQLTEGKIKGDIKRLYTFYRRCLSSHRTLSITRKYYYELCGFMANAELNSYFTHREDILRKISFCTTDELTRSFIDYCAMHPVLWDKNHPNYSVLSYRKAAYDEIALNLQQFYNVEFGNEDLYYAISRLKHHYYSLQRKKSQHETLTKEEQDLLDRCNFLPKSKNNLKCNICDRVLRSQNTLQTHLLKVHNVGELPYKCDYCEQRFAQRNLKKEHEVRAHTKEFEWLCPFCSKGFVNRRDMEKHQMVHTGERKIICEKCGKRFRLKNQMTEHVKTVHERLRRFKCSMCPKDFLRKRTLDDHIRAHLNIRDKICNICNKGFTSFHGLFRHKQLHSEKRYECIKCGKGFHRFSSLRLHEKLKHNIITKQSDNTVNSSIDE